jgi:hypothetical protein
LLLVFFFKLHLFPSLPFAVFPPPVPVSDFTGAYKSTGQFGQAHFPEFRYDPGAALTISLFGSMPV